jgi:hypothetical protein
MQITSGRKEGKKLLDIFYYTDYASLQQQQNKNSIKGESRSDNLLKQNNKDSFFLDRQMEI